MLESVDLPFYCEAKGMLGSYSGTFLGCRSDDLQGNHTKTRINYSNLVYIYTKYTLF